MSNKMTLEQYLNKKEVCRLNYGEVIIDPYDKRVSVHRVHEGYYNVKIDLGLLGQFSYFVEHNKKDKAYEFGILKYYTGTNKTEIAKSVFRLNMETLEK